MGVCNQSTTLVSGLPLSVWSHHTIAVLAAFTPRAAAKRSSMRPTAGGAPSDRATSARAQREVTPGARAPVSPPGRRGPRRRGPPAGPVSRERYRPVASSLVRATGGPAERAEPACVVGHLSVAART
jgi:hypothetical protein